MKRLILILTVCLVVLIPLSGRAQTILGDDCSNGSCGIAPQEKITLGESEIHTVVTNPTKESLTMMNQAAVVNKSNIDADTQRRLQATKDDERQHAIESKRLVIGVDGRVVPAEQH